MVFYKKNNGDLAPVDNTLDRLLLLFSFNYPFVAFIARDPEAMARVPVALRGGLNGLASLLFVLTIALAVVWFGRQIQRAILGEPLNVPKYLLLAAAIPMHWIVLLTPMPHKPIAIVAILTIYHNLQYHRLIWFHNKKYSANTVSGGRVPLAVASESSAKPKPRDKYGAAELISRHLLYYIAFGLLFGLIYQGPRQLLGYLSLQKGSAAANRKPLPIKLNILFLWGYPFFHYSLNSKFCRVVTAQSVGKPLNR